MDQACCQLCGSPLRGEFCLDCGAHRVLPHDLVQAYNAKPAGTGALKFRLSMRTVIAMIALPILAIAIGRLAMRSGATISVDQNSAIAEETSDASAPADVSRSSTDARSEVSKRMHWPRHSRSLRGAKDHHKASPKVADSTIKQESSM